MGKVVTRDGLRRYFATAPVESTLRPVIAPEQFSIEAKGPPKSASGGKRMVRLTRNPAIAAAS